MIKKLPNWVGYIVLCSLISGFILTLVNFYFGFSFSGIKIIALSLTPLPTCILVYAVIRKEIFTGAINSNDRWVQLNDNLFAFILNFSVWIIILITLIKVSL